MPTEYSYEEGLDKHVQDYLKNMHEWTAIRENGVKITTCLCVRTDADENPVSTKGDPVVLKRISGVTRVFVDADYVLVIDQCSYDSADKDSQYAMIHHALKRICVVKDEKSGKVKLSKNKPVEFFIDTLVRYGLWNSVFIDVAQVIGQSHKKFVEQFNPPDVIPETKSAGSPAEPELPSAPRKAAPKQRKEAALKD